MNLKSKEMKKLFAIGLLLFSVQLKAQVTYINMLDTNVIWSERTHTAEDNSNSYYSYLTDGDTLINDKQYFKLYFLSYELRLIGFIRENDSGQVYIRISGTNISLAGCSVTELDSTLLNEDLLLLDLNVEIGDTLFTPFYGIDEYIISYVVINDIQYLILGNQVRKVLSFIDSFEFYGNFVEGIGSDYGLFRFWCTEGNGVRNILDCYINDGQMVYGACIVNVASESKIIFNVFPNPANDKITISIDQNKTIDKVRIYDITSVLIFENPIFESEMEIELSALSPGMYLLEVETEDGFREVKRLIVE